MSQKNVNSGNISSIHLVDQGSNPATPASGRKRLFATAKELWMLLSDGSRKLASVPDYICILDQKAAGVAGGTFTQGARRTRDVNTEQSDAGELCIISNNQFTLVAGTYVANIRVPATAVNGHKTWLRNITDNVDTLIGSTMYSGAADVGTNNSCIVGKFTIANSKTFEIQHQCDVTRSDWGFGNATNFGSPEVYTIAEFWKVG